MICAAHEHGTDKLHSLVVCLFFLLFQRTLQQWSVERKITSGKWKKSPCNQRKYGESSLVSLVHFSMREGESERESEARPTAGGTRRDIKAGVTRIVERKAPLEKNSATSQFLGLLDSRLCNSASFIQLTDVGGGRRKEGAEGISGEIASSFIVKLCWLQTGRRGRKRKEEKLQEKFFLFLPRPVCALKKEPPLMLLEGFHPGKKICALSMQPACVCREEGKEREGGLGKVLCALPGLNGWSKEGRKG